MSIVISSLFDSQFPKSAKGVKIRSSSRLASQVTVAGPVGSSSQITNGNVSIEVSILI